MPLAKKQKFIVLEYPFMTSIAEHRQWLVFFASYCTFTNLPNRYLTSIHLLTCVSPELMLLLHTLHLSIIIYFHIDLLEFLSISHNHFFPSLDPGDSQIIPSWVTTHTRMTFLIQCLQVLRQYIAMIIDTVMQFPIAWNKNCDSTSSC